MIPFEEVDMRLKRLGKNRTWLADVTGRSPESMRSALAPKARPAHRSSLLQHAITRAIEHAEASRPFEAGPHKIVLAVSDAELMQWIQTANNSGLPVAQWALQILRRNS